MKFRKLHKEVPKNLSARRLYSEFMSFSPTSNADKAMYEYMVKSGAEVGRYEGVRFLVS